MALSGPFQHLSIRAYRRHRETSNMVRTLDDVYIHKYDSMPL